MKLVGTALPSTKKYFQIITTMGKSILTALRYSCNGVISLLIEGLFEAFFS